MEKQSEIIFKRILFLSKLIFSFLVISLILLLNFIDFKELKNYSEYLTTLNKIGASRDEDFSEENLEHKIAAWLVASNREIAEKYSEARRALSTVLIKNGAPARSIYASKGYNGGKNNFQAIAFKKAENPREIFSSSMTVKQSIDYFNYLARPINIDVLSSVDTSIFKDKINALPKHWDDETFGDENGRNNLILNSFIFESLSFKSDSVILLFTEDIGAQQRLPNQIEISLPAKHNELTAPSPLVFVGFDSTLIDRMRNDQIQLKEIDALYGNQSIYKTEDLVAKSIESNTGSVSIIGFDISRKWFPMTMLVALFFINVIIAKNLKNARQQNLKVFSTIVSEDALELLVTNKIIRLGLWVLSSLFICFSIYYSSFITYSTVYYIGMAIISIGTIIYGIIAFNISKKQ